MSAGKTLFDPLFDKNPVLLQVLGICSALAVTTQMTASVVVSGLNRLATMSSSVAITASGSFS